jgi:hypothetical protein
MPNTISYSLAELQRMKDAIRVLVGEKGEDVYERFMLIEEGLTNAVRSGKRVEEVEYAADEVAREVAPDLKRDILCGQRAQWEDPGYIDWYERRGLSPRRSF